MDVSGRKSEVYSARLLMGHGVQHWINVHMGKFGQNW